MPPEVWFRASIVWLKPTSVSRTKGAVRAMPSMYRVSPLGAVSKGRFTFCGNTVTDFVSLRPLESVTVSVMR